MAHMPESHSVLSATPSRWLPAFPLASCLAWSSLSLPSLCVNPHRSQFLAGELLLLSRYVLFLVLGPSTRQKATQRTVCFSLFEGLQPDHHGRKEWWQSLRRLVGHFTPAARERKVRGANAEFTL